MKRYRKELLSELECAEIGDSVWITFRPEISSEAAKYLLECEYFEQTEKNTQYLTKIVSIGYNYKQTFALEFQLKESVSMWNPFLYTLQDYIASVCVKRKEIKKTYKNNRRKKV